MFKFSRRLRAFGFLAILRHMTWRSHQKFIWFFRHIIKKQTCIFSLSISPQAPLISLQFGNLMDIHECYSQKHTSTARVAHQCKEFKSQKYWTFVCFLSISHSKFNIKKKSYYKHSIQIEHNFFSNICYSLSTYVYACLEKLSLWFKCKLNWDLECFFYTTSTTKIASWNGYFSFTYLYILVPHYTSTEFHFTLHFLLNASQWHSDSKLTFIFTLIAFLISSKITTSSTQLICHCVWNNPLP